MHLGSRHTEAVLRIMAHDGRGTKPCPLCEECNLKERILMEHLMEHRDEEQYNRNYGCSAKLIGEGQHNLIMRTLTD